MPILDFITSFYEDSRGNRIERATAVTFVPPEARWLYLDAPESAVRQILEHCGDPCHEVALTSIPYEEGKGYARALYFPSGMSDRTRELVNGLKRTLSLRLAEQSALEFCLALDFYKVPEEGVAPTEWQNSEAGELVNRGKYRSGQQAATATAQLCDRLAATVSMHPALASATTVASLPGHLANGQSFGERVASRVASMTGKPYAQLVSRAGARDQAKEGTGVLDLRGDIYSNDHIPGPLILIDDVFRTGKSLESAALGATLAGAGPIYALVAARTLRR